MLPREKMCPGARKLRDVYELRPGAPFYQTEFGYYCLERWAEQGMPADVPKEQLFGYDPPGEFESWLLGGSVPKMFPEFEELVVEDRGEYEVVRDKAGRHVLFFKGRRDGFMPEYLDHAVKDFRTWEEDVKWRFDTGNAERQAQLEGWWVEKAVEEARTGKMITQHMSGGYAFLRALIGSVDLLYMFYDDPALIHDMMQTWLAVTDHVIAGTQRRVTLDKLLLSEDICYKSGALISPEMMREFLFPYYRQLFANVSARQIDAARKLHIEIDTDGHAPAVISVYAEIGVDAMSPFEVAADCDVVQIAQQYPKLIISGGVDKREMAKGRDAIDRLVDRIFPAMQARGGYIPTCDHGVPEEVSYADYLYYRQRCLEFA